MYVCMYIYIYIYIHTYTYISCASAEARTRRQKSTQCRGAKLSRLPGLDSTQVGRERERERIYAHTIRLMVYVPYTT